MSADPTRLTAALAGLQRFGDAGAIRAKEHLESAIELSEQRGTRWTERMCYSLREVLESIPPLFGQKKGNPPGKTARLLSNGITEAIAVDHPPDVLRRLVSDFKEELTSAESRRRYRVAQAMMVQAGADASSPRVDAFASEWTSTVEGINRILHGDEHSEDEALSLLERSIDLLGALVGPISSRLEEMDELAARRSPAELDVRRVLDLVADERLARYFFSKVDSPAWLQPLDDRGVFDVPMQGDWYQGGFLVRVSARAPERASEIAARLVGDPHRAGAVVILGVVRELGSEGLALGIRALSAESYQDTFGVAHELELLIEEWASRGETQALHELADVALEPQRDEPRWRVGGKFREFEYDRLVGLFVTHSTCQHLPLLTEILVYKLRRAESLLAGGAGLSFGRDLVSADERSDRDVGNALISGLRDSLRRLRDCDVDLEARQTLLGDLDSEILVRIWAGHLAEEEAHGS